MSSVRNKLLKEIEIKANKIKTKRVEAASNKTIEAAAFEFFKNIEESRHLHNGKKYDDTLFHNAKKALELRVRGIDRQAKISVEFNSPEDPTSWEEQLVRGVTIWWGQAHIVKNNVEPSFYVDVACALLFNC